jgi:hypothetical protein
MTVTIYHNPNCALAIPRSALWAALCFNRRL